MAARSFGLAALLWAAFVVPASAADLVPAKGAEAKTDDAVSVEIDVSLMSDYVYRGVSLSARKPSGATSIEAEWHGFYANANVQSVRLPTSPAAEITLTGGYRWEYAGFKLDLNANYFWYPGEILPEDTPATSYWEYGFGAERKIADPITLKALVAYSPNVSGTGAWGTYTQAGIEIELPKFGDVAWHFNASAGYWRLGNVLPMLGGFPLPSYVNWRLGLEFNFKDRLTFDLSYWDTNLSQENCFVFTGDTMATAGGGVDPISNPNGLRSRLCSAALVATLTAKFDLSDLK